MRLFWKVLSLAGGALAIGAGTVMIMSSFEHHPSNTAEAAQRRMEALCWQWEARLESARSLFRDRLLRHSVMTVMEHPEDWAGWRIEHKFATMMDSWPTDAGRIRGLALALSDNEIRAMHGDSCGISVARQMLDDAPEINMVLFRSPDDDGVILAVTYCLPAMASQGAPGCVIALLDAGTVMGVPGIEAGRWALCSEGQSVIMSSEDQSTAAAIAAQQWPQLLTTHGGNAGSQIRPGIAYSVLRLPGMTPQLLIRPLPPVRAVGWVAGFLLLCLGGGMLLVLVRRRAKAVLLPEGPFSYRAVFQSLEDPVCVITVRGQILRANRVAEELLAALPRNGAPTLTVHFDSATKSLPEFLTEVAAAGDGRSRACRIRRGDELRFQGTVSTVRLHSESNEGGAFLLHFRMASREAVAVPVLAPYCEQMPDPQNPFPVIYVTPEGLIQFFNEAALKTCPRIKDTPVIADVLPSLEPVELTRLLEHPNGSSFESLFGPGPFSFMAVPMEEGVLLYGHPMAASNTLEVALRQAQENFYRLSAVVPHPVLLVDPRSHHVIEANPAAGHLFRTDPNKLCGRILDSLSRSPIDLTVSRGAFYAETPNGLLDCQLLCEMIKIEGAPMILVVLLPTCDATHGATDEYLQASSVNAAQTSDIWENAVGSAVLVSLNPVVREVARKLLLRTGHLTEVFSSLDSAMTWLIRQGHRPEMIVVDISEFPEAADWVSEVRGRHGPVACLAITDGVTFGLPSDGANAYLTKPFDLDSLAGALGLLGLPVELAEINTDRA